MKSWLLGQTLLSRAFFIFFLVGCTDLWGILLDGVDDFIIPKLDSLVGEISFFFWINFTKHHKITMHCTLTHEPFFSFSTNENISLHWNMNGDLKLVSWITHLQPFFSQLHLLIKSRGSEREVLLFQCWHSPSLHVLTCCCYHLGTLCIQEGKNTKTVSKVDLTSVC